MMAAMTISSHVLDTAQGRPAQGVPVLLQRYAGDWQTVGEFETDADGRVRDLLGGTAMSAGRYRVSFDTKTYFDQAGRPVFYPLVEVTFDAASASEHYHIPLLLSPFGYSTYRGS